MNQLQAKIVKTAGILLPEQTISTEPERYRTEFMKYVFPVKTLNEVICIIHANLTCDRMMEEYVEVLEDSDGEPGPSRSNNSRN